MKIDVFNKVVKEQLLVCEHLLTGKGHEYAPDAVDADKAPRLHLGYVYRWPQLLS